MFGNLPPLISALNMEAAPLAVAHAPTRMLSEAHGISPNSGSVRFGRCEVRIACREVLVDGNLRPLQPLPFDLLVYLIVHRDRVVPIDELLDAHWGDRCVEQGSLPAAIMRVRKALGGEDASVDEVIRTYPRVGYRFVALVEGDPPSW